jgi:5-methyltetrahydrofolate--homocysteine methyltransferase
MEAEKQAGGSRSQGKILLATVKGDVHDIGKNIVGVVLACNNYEVIDLGVMVPCDKILATAREHNVDIIGLSGLITPSLDEMAFVAGEMERRGMALPLLIGGATTSRQHTAVKIAPEYSGPVVHVVDASRAVDVVSSLLSDSQRATFTQANRSEQDRVRAQHRSLKRRDIVPIAAARERRLQLSFGEDVRAVPAFLGAHLVEDVRIEDLVPFIDWTLFFSAWELKGRFPAILEHPKYGQAARDLFADGQATLNQLIADRTLSLGAVYGFWPANTVGDDIVLYAPDAPRGTELLRFNMLRQQEDLGDDRPHLSLADFVAPQASGEVDYVGAFAVTAGIGVDALVSRYQSAHDDYRAIIVKAIADRLAEAYAEYLHKRARHDWGYGAEEALSQTDLIDERYRGIRPAFGYPACPDHSEKTKLFALLQAERAGLRLTESFAMMPAAAVSGLYLSHPQARYFDVGRFGRDQVADYARRKGTTIAQVERWLAPHLGYDPDTTNVKTPEPVALDAGI